MNNINKNDYNTLIELAIQEDLSDIGDATSDSIFPKGQIAEFTLFAKQNGILCGTDIFIDVFQYIDAQCDILFNYQDRDHLSEGSIIANLKGDIGSILKAERTALNFLSLLSGISTKTSQFVKAANGKLKILDTRKTLPGMRNIQKYAVYCGGGENHRIGLYDMVMIKDNHIDAAGSITKAVALVRKKWKDRFKIEVETRNINEVNEALTNQVDRIMLDNMSKNMMQECVKIIDNQAEIEASGNMTLERIEELSDIGLDFISFGELTHTIRVFDFSLKMKKTSKTEK